jgi:hypothetical protein
MVAEAGQLRRAEPDDAPVTWGQCAEVAVVTVVALGLALALPLATSVFALLLFGVLHNYFEIRYVVGRFGGLFSGRLGEAVLIGLTGVVLIRLVPLGQLARPAEIVATYGLLGAILALRLRSAPLVLGVGALGLLVGLTVSLTHADYHFVAITHLHNILPLMFLWEWSSGVAATARGRAFRLLHLVWALFLPGLVLAGLLSPLGLPDATIAPSVVRDVDGFVRALVPPGGDAVLGGRLLAVFALLQLMHYYVWCRFFPMVGGAEAAAFDRTMHDLRLPYGQRLTGLVVLFAGLTLVLLWTDFRLGRSLYGALAGYHAYLEYALLLLFVLAWRRPTAEGVRHDA